MKRIGLLLLWAVGVFFLARAIAEFILTDYSSPTSYRDDWGGPSLAGVLTVHTLPGVIAASLMARDIVRRSRASRATNR
jgi:hypothetical protein